MARAFSQLNATSQTTFPARGSELQLFNVEGSSIDSSVQNLKTVWKMMNPQQQKVCASSTQPRLVRKRKIRGSDGSSAAKKAWLPSQNAANATKDRMVQKSAKRSWSAVNNQRKPVNRKSRKCRSLPVTDGTSHLTHVQCRPLPLSMSMFKMGRCLGSGACGSVYEAIRKSDQRKVALKVVKPAGMPAFREMPNGEVIPEEVFFQNKVKHPAIIESLGHFWHGDSVVMVMEAPEKPCDLADYLVENELINEGEARGIFRKVVEAAIHCEKRRVFHRDIKTENIILDLADDEFVKLADFGLATRMRDGPYRRFMGTDEFCPPEFFARHQYHATSGTVWSLGCLIVDMLSWDLPYENPRDALTAPPRIPGNLSNDAKDLIRRMLARDPKARPSLQEIRQHPWLN